MSFTHSLPNQRHIQFTWQSINRFKDDAHKLLMGNGSVPFAPSKGKQCCICDCCTVTMYNVNINPSTRFLFKWHKLCDGSGAAARKEQWTSTEKQSNNRTGLSPDSVTVCSKLDAQMINGTGTNSFTFRLQQPPSRGNMLHPNLLNRNQYRRHTEL